jgi:hypothetical protein
MSRSEVYISADIGGFGTEIRRTDDPERLLIMTPPAELGLSDGLVDEIRAWQKWFDEAVTATGLEERFQVLDDRFDEIGWHLAERVGEELGARFRIVYVPQGGWCRQVGRGRSIIVQE